jgi:hypothetical protein
LKPRPPTRRVSPVTRFTVPACRAHYPGGSRRVHVSIASPLTRPSPFCRRVGIRTSTFEACSGFTHVTARRIAQPSKAAFVTRLRLERLLVQAVRQLPDQSTILGVEPTSHWRYAPSGRTKNYGLVVKGKWHHSSVCKYRRPACCFNANWDTALDCGCLYPLLSDDVRFCCVDPAIRA